MSENEEKPAGDARTQLATLLHVGDVVRHRRSRLVGHVTGFAHNGTTDVMVDETGPYPQTDFEQLRGKGEWT